DLVRDALQLLLEAQLLRQVFLRNRLALEYGAHKYLAFSDPSARTTTLSRPFPRSSPEAPIEVPPTGALMLGSTRGLAPHASALYTSKFESLIPLQHLRPPLLHPDRDLLHDQLRLARLEMRDEDLRRRFQLRELRGEHAGAQVLGRSRQV